MLRRWGGDRLVSPRCSPIASRSRARATPWIFQHRNITPGQRFQADVVPLRKQLKEAQRASRISPTQSSGSKHDQDRLSQWRLTVGIEIHAQLNTGSKLFSRAKADYTDVPNAALWPFDLAVPGSQPLFQAPVLIPALRAALALNCQVQRRSKFDRKHYFYHDQPAGYQITQYYEPLAVNGHLRLIKDDGLAEEDGESLDVGIKQIQLEQDTAKSQSEDERTILIDYNRSGHALIEIISLPQIHSPQAAAAYVRKVQAILYSVDAATAGMELGGLRADVNVSVRKIGDDSSGHAYSGVSGLGQRTEIKNLSSFKAVEDAVRAEMIRQITLLEDGQKVMGETRGWSLSSPDTTHRLRGKEGEVDYRYMPDPDIEPIYIGKTLSDHLRTTLPPVPDQLLDMLRDSYGLTTEDAKAMMMLDNGDRLLYYQDVVSRVRPKSGASRAHVGVQVGNWILHELGSLLTVTETQWSPDLIKPQQMADLISLLENGEITRTSAKRLLRILFDGQQSGLSVAQIVEQEGLLFSAFSDTEYDELAGRVVSEHPEEVAIYKSLEGDEKSAKKRAGKFNFLLGQVLRQGGRDRLEPLKATEALKQKLAATT